MSALAVRQSSTTVPDAQTAQIDAAVSVGPFKYRAFISYSHRDAKWVQRFHRALERQHIDKDLAGRETAHGAVPKTLRPIFRDREDFSAGHSLTEQTAAALGASHSLIVVCSPNAARSQYVDREIRYFKSLGRGVRVINVIIAGRPGDAEHECFPPAVRQVIGIDGTVTGERADPIAADARPQGDGYKIARLKIVAGLLGVGFDEIVRRAERARKRRNRIRIIGAVTIILVFTAAFVGWRGVHLLHSQLLDTEDLNDARETADICDHATPLATTEAWRIALAAKCVQGFSELLSDLPDGTLLPKRVASSFAANLATLRRFASANKLTPAQSNLLTQATIRGARFGVH